MFPRHNGYYNLLLSIFVNKLISTREIFTFPPVSPLGLRKNSCLSNPIPHPEYLHFSISPF